MTLMGALVYLVILEYLSIGPLKNEYFLVSLCDLQRFHRSFNINLIC